MKLLKLLRDRFRLTRALSRRFLEEGRIFVGERRAESLDMDVSRYAPVIIDGTTVLFHKPEGYVVSRSEKGSPVIYDILPSEMIMLNPVGRLDKDSSGLLLLMLDGILQHRLTHPRYGIVRDYVVVLDRQPDEDYFSGMVGGVRLGDEFLRALKVISINAMEIPDGLREIWMRDVDVERAVLVRMDHGKYREIRRLSEALGYHVQLLRRVRYSRLDLDVPEGQWRHLTLKEVLNLMEDVGLIAP